MKIIIALACVSAFLQHVAAATVQTAYTTVSEAPPTDSTSTGAANTATEYVEVHSTIVSTIGAGVTTARTTVSSASPSVAKTTIYRIHTQSEGPSDSYSFSQYGSTVTVENTNEKLVVKTTTQATLDQAAEQWNGEGAATTVDVLAPETVEIKTTTMKSVPSPTRPFRHIVTEYRFAKVQNVTSNRTSSSPASNITQISTGTGMPVPLNSSAPLYSNSSSAVSSTASASGMVNTAPYANASTTRGPYTNSSSTSLARQTGASTGTALIASLSTTRGSYANITTSLVPQTNSTSKSSFGPYMNSTSLVVPTNTPDPSANSTDMAPIVTILMTTNTILQNCTKCPMGTTTLLVSYPVTFTPSITTDITTVYQVSTATNTIIQDCAKCPGGTTTTLSLYSTLYSPTVHTITRNTVQALSTESSVHQSVYIATITTKTIVRECSKCPGGKTTSLSSYSMSLPGTIPPEETVTTIRSGTRNTRTSTVYSLHSTTITIHDFSLTKTASSEQPGSTASSSSHHSSSEQPHTIPVAYITTTITEFVTKSCTSCPGGTTIYLSSYPVTKTASRSSSTWSPSWATKSSPQTTPTKSTTVLQTTSTISTLSDSSHVTKASSSPSQSTTPSSVSSSSPISSSSSNPSKSSPTSTSSATSTTGTRTTTFKTQRGSTTQSTTVDTPTSSTSSKYSTKTVTTTSQTTLDITVGTSSQGTSAVTTGTGSSPSSGIRQSSGRTTTSKQPMTTASSASSEQVPSGTKTGPKPTKQTEAPESEGIRILGITGLALLVPVAVALLV